MELNEIGAKLNQIDIFDLIKQDDKQSKESEVGSIETI